MTAVDLAPRQMSFALPTANIDGSLSPLEFRHPVLAAELADALIIMRRVLVLSDGTAYHYRRTIMSVLRDLPESCPRTISLSSTEPSVVDAFHEWESALAGTYAAESNVPHRQGTRLRRLIRILDSEGRDVGARLLRWAQSPVLHRGGVDTPLDEFSNAERLAIRDACRTRIRELEARLVVGRGLIVSGTDPRAVGSPRPADILWGVRHLGRTPETSIEQEVRNACGEGALDGLDVKFADVQPATPGGANRVMRRLMAYLYPSSEDLAAFRTLLQLETGAAPEEWSGVTLGDITHVSDALLVRLHKARAHRTRTVRCRTTGSEDSGGWRAGDLILRLLAATENARSEAQDGADAAAEMLFCTVQRSVKRTLAFRAESFSRHPFTSLLTSISPPISRPYDARRLRKTVKSVRAAVLRSASLAADDDHSIAVYQRHYAQSTTVHVLAGAAVNAAQQQVFDRLRGPMFVNAPAEAIKDGATETLASAAAAEVASSPTERTMNVTHCTSPYESPYAPAGRLCEHRPSMCFACPNAIVFVDHLPRIVAYREILRGHQNEMPPAQFAAAHGQQLRNVEQILSEISSDERERAQGAAENMNAPVHVPLSQRGVHL